MKKIILLTTVSLFVFSIEGNGQSFLKKVLAPTLAAAAGKSNTNAETATANSTAGVTQKGGTKIVTNHPNMSVKIKSCKASGETCVIDMIMINTSGRDILVCLYTGQSSSRAYDDEGNEYGGRNLLLGKTGGSLEGRAVHETRAYVSLPSNVPLKVSMQLEGVPEDATQFLRINLSWGCDELDKSMRDKPMIFTNIPITRDGDE